MVKGERVLFPSENNVELSTRKVFAGELSTFWNYKLDHNQITQGQAPMQFDAYFNMLQNAAQQIDHEN